MHSSSLCTCTSDGLKEQECVENADTIKKLEFVIPTIPTELIVPQERANYLITHYWDNFDFSDTAYIHLPKITEQAFANYIELLPHATKPISYFSINDMLLKAETGSQDMRGYFSLDFHSSCFNIKPSPWRVCISFLSKPLSIFDLR